MLHITEYVLLGVVYLQDFPGLVLLQGKHKFLPSMRTFPYQVELLEISTYKVGGLVGSKRLRQGKDMDGLDEISLSVTITP